MQRAVDLTRLTPTQNHDYYIDPNDRDVLYSDTDAVPPKPRGLYFHSLEATTANGQVDKWKPNARLVSSQERQNGISTKQALAMARMIEEIDVSGDLADLPSLGILGKNDCDNFALQLTTLVARENARYAPNFVGDTTIDHVTINNAPKLDVGDRMKHVFQGPNLACGHHGATLVAQDGADAVTLEAHVSQNIQAPKFHIRQGAVGFIADNNANQDLGTQAQFQHWRSLDQQTVDQEIRAMELRFERMSGRQHVMHMEPQDHFSTAPGATWGPGRRIAQEQTRRNQFAALQRIRTLVDDNRWSSQGKGTLFGPKKPSGVVDIQSVLAGGLFVLSRNTQEKLQYCQAKGAYKLAHPDGDRSQATTDLYSALSNLNPADPDLVTLVNQLGTAESGL